MGFINHLTLPEYYYLYGLFFDYPINNAFHIGREERARIRDLLRFIQPLAALRQPYRKNFALRLFTERQTLERFPPHKVDEALRQLKQEVERIRGRADGSPPDSPTAKAHRLLTDWAEGKANGEAPRAHGESPRTKTAPPETPPAEPMPRPWPGVDPPPPPIRYLLTA